MNKEILDVSLGNKSVEKLSKKFSAFFKATNQLSICWKGKSFVRSCCEKINVKPLKQFLSTHDLEVILLIVTTAQLSLAEFCLSFKEAYIDILQKGRVKKIQPV